MMYFTISKLRTSAHLKTPQLLFIKKHTQNRRSLWYTYRIGEVLCDTNNQQKIYKQQQQENLLQIPKKKSDNQPIEKWGRDNTRNFIIV